MNKLRNDCNIKLLGKTPPNPVCSSKELVDTHKISAVLCENINSCSYTKLTPVQMQAIPVLLKVRTIFVIMFGFLFKTSSRLQERELLCSAPTGSGKTAAFLIPIIHHLKAPQKQGFRAMILCPTRELAKQIQREFLRLTENIGLRSHIIAKIGNKTDKDYRKALKSLYDVLITTPKRLCLALQQNPPMIDLKG
jgi:ATP-dependent RNA helicase DDX52/ROK1